MLGLMSEPLSPTPTPPPATSRAARPGLFGGLVSSKQRRSGQEPGESDDKKKSKKPIHWQVVLDDAADLVRARKGRLAFGLLLMIINRLCGLVLPWTTKSLLDDVI